MPKAHRKAPLRPLPEHENLEVDGAAALKIFSVIDQLETQVEDKILGMMATAAEAVFQLKNEFTRQLLHMPKKTRALSLSDFRRQYPEDFQTAAIAQIDEKFATIEQELAKNIPLAAGRAARSTTKRSGEPETVLRTTRRKGAPHASNSASDFLKNSRVVIEAPQGSYIGRQLQTPMPFAGEAIPAAVTLLTQKRGGRTRGASSTDAAVITTSDGQQWAVGKQGLALIPETHRNEVQELLSAQFEFFAAALGKTVFARGRR